MKYERLEEWKVTFATCLSNSASMEPIRQDMTEAQAEAYLLRLFLDAVEFGIQLGGMGLKENNHE